MATTPPSSSLRPDADTSKAASTSSSTAYPNPIPESVPALLAPPPKRDNPYTRSKAGLVGMGVLAFMILVCIASLPWTTGIADSSNAATNSGVPRYNAGETTSARVPPMWVTPNQSQALRLNAMVPEETLARVAQTHGVSAELALKQTSGPVFSDLKSHWPRWFLGTDTLGRSLLIRVLTGGGISLAIGIAAALLSVFIGTMYGAIAGYAGGRLDAVMMRIVDILYGLPYVLLVVLLAVAGDALVDEYTTRAKAKASYIQEQSVLVAIKQNQPADTVGIERMLGNDPLLQERLTNEAVVAFPSRNLSSSQRMRLDVLTLLVAIGGVSWLTMARVIRGQVLSLKTLPFIEAARALGASRTRIFLRHLLPNLMGPIIVYATLTVPQAILQESFLSFLGIGVKPPLPSWGNLASEGLSELNPVESNWWLLVFPCLLLSVTLLALNFVGEGLREAMDPKRGRR